MRAIPGFVLVAVLAGSVVLPLGAVGAQKPLTYAAWIPYWKKADGVAEALAHIEAFKELSPFAYEVKPDGTLSDKLKLESEPYAGLVRAMREKKIKLVPSVLWLDGDAMHAVLSSSTARKAHVERIAALVASSSFDGIDIDYENKKVETKTYFSKFIAEIAIKLHKNKKLLSCSIEPRTPANARFSVVPKTLEFSNNYAVINRYCDEVRVMAYDQGKIDLRLNKMKGTSALYSPIADMDWVRKVVAETMKSVSARKILLGTATYGYEYAIERTASSIKLRRVRSYNYMEAMNLANSVGATPARNSAGELNFTYTAAVSSTVALSVASSSAPTATPLAAAGAAVSSTRLVWFSDAASAAEKVKLAQRLGLKGIAIFKLDGGADPLLWNVIPAER